MTAKEYLNQAFHIDKQINEYCLELEALDSDVCRCTQAFSDMPPGEHNGNKVEVGLVNYIDKCEDLRQKINEESDLLADTKKDIRSKIYQIKDPKFRLVLAKRYILFKKWECIQVEMKYQDLRSVYKVHNKALMEFIKIHGNNFLGH